MAPNGLFFDMIAYLCQVCFHAYSILVVDDVEEFLQLGAYLRHLVVGVGVEENLLQQVVVFRQHTLGNLHVALEGGARSILMFHHGCKDEG